MQEKAHLQGWSCQPFERGSILIFIKFLFLFLKNFSDRQIVIDKKLIDFIIKRVERSYGKIFEFIYKIDKISLKKKKSIDFKIINEALEE